MDDIPGRRQLHNGEEKIQENRFRIFFSFVSFLILTCCSFCEEWGRWSSSVAQSPVAAFPSVCSAGSSRAKSFWTTHHPPVSAFSAALWSNSIPTWIYPDPSYTCPSPDPSRSPGDNPWHTSLSLDSCSCPVDTPSFLFDKKKKSRSGILTAELTLQSLVSSLIPFASLNSSITALKPL